jgi:hypothetical protein
MVGPEKVQKNALTLVAVVVLGTIANIVGAAVDFSLKPIIAAGAVHLMFEYSYWEAGDPKMSHQDARQMLRNLMLDQSAERSMWVISRGFHSGSRSDLHQPLECQR